jgi:hypothetical protein
VVETASSTELVLTIDARELLDDTPFVRFADKPWLKTRKARLTDLLLKKNTIP